MSSPDARAIARDVVVGTRHWSELGRLGISVTRTAAGLTIEEPAGYEGVDVSLSEIVQGLVAYRDSPEDLQVWALLARTLANVDEAVETPEREELLDLLWDLSFGAELQPAQLDRFLDLRPDDSN